MMSNVLPVDLATNAESLGCHVIRCENVSDVVQALQDAPNRSTGLQSSTCATIATWVCRDIAGGMFRCAEVSELDSVNAAREEWEEKRTQERYYI